MTGVDRARLDVALVARSLVPTRSTARRVIGEGRVTVDGEVCRRPATRVGPFVTIEVDPSATRYVSRGGLKLEAALDAFGIEVVGRDVVDVGASTGGFTDCALQRGARHVVSVDVGTGQLHESLRVDPRVTSHESCDIRSVDAGALGGPFDVVVVDVSFISLGNVAGALVALGGPSTDYVVLVKPQFEVGRDALRKDGVVREPATVKTAVEHAVSELVAAGLTWCAAVSSPIEGGAGNVEVLVWLRSGENPHMCRSPMSPWQP